MRLRETAALSPRRTGLDSRCDRRAGVGLDPDAAVVDLVVEERAHQLLVGAVAQRLGLAADRGGVLGRVGRPLLGEPAAPRISSAAQA